MRKQNAFCVYDKVPRYSKELPEVLRKALERQAASA